MATEIPPPCERCPGQHQVVLRFTVCSPCDSTIALGEALAVSLSAIKVGYVQEHSETTGKTTEVRWVLKAIEVQK